MAAKDDLSEAPVGGTKKFRANREVQKWLNHFSAYDREFKTWEGRVQKICKRYRDDFRDGQRGYQEARFNILWSNIQTLIPAVFSRIPKPQVTRRFNDNDPIARIAGLILERGLDYEIQHYPDYAETLKQVILDRYLGGRGVSWQRYEPHVKAQRLNEPVDGVQVTEDVDKPDEELDYECAPQDYVNWKDFGHTVARTWPEVTAVWRCVYMSRMQIEERFPDWVNQIPMDANPEELGKNNDYSGGSSEEYTRARIYEIWDKTKKEVLWLSKGVKKIIDRVDDPLGFEEFWPCPKPLYATLTNDSLVPVPDFALIQDQANELDILCDRIDGLIKALKVCGGYDASIPELQRIFTEAQTGTLIPIKNWPAFSEKNGVDGALSLVDLDPIARALKESYAAFEAVKAQVYELTGISDIVRGQSVASETATAQQIKSQYASLRLKMQQREVAEFASAMICAKAQVICNKFDPSTLAQIACVEQMQISPSDAQGLLPPPPPQMPQQPGTPPAPPPPQPSPEQIKQLVIGKAMELLFGERLQNPDTMAPNPLRSFRIEVAADSLLMIDDREEKEARAEFLGAVGNTLKNLAPIMAQIPAFAPMVLELVRFAAQSYKIGRSIEGVFDQTMEAVKQQMSQPQQNPEAEKAKAEIQKMQMEMQIEREKGQNEIAVEKEKGSMEIQLERERMQVEREKHQDEMARNAAQHQMQMQQDQSLHAQQMQLTQKDHAQKSAHQRDMDAQAISTEQQKAKAQNSYGRKIARDPRTGDKTMTPFRMQQ